MNTFEVTIKMDGKTFWFVRHKKDGIAIEDGSGRLHRHRPVQVSNAASM
jgi:hypothetical protein